MSIGISEYWMSCSKWNEIKSHTQIHNNLHDDTRFRAHNSNYNTVWGLVSDDLRPRPDSNVKWLLHMCICTSYYVYNKEQPAKEDVTDFVINIIKLQYNKIRHAAHQWVVTARASMMLLLSLVFSVLQTL